MGHNLLLLLQTNLLISQMRSQGWQTGNPTCPVTKLANSKIRTGIPGLCSSPRAPFKDPQRLYAWTLKIPKDFTPGLEKPLARSQLFSEERVVTQRWNQRREAELVTLLGHRPRNPRVHSVSPCGILPASLPSRSGWSTPFTVPVPAPRVKVKTPEPALPTPQTCPPNGARVSAPGEPVEEFSHLSQLHRPLVALLSEPARGRNLRAVVSLDQHFPCLGKGVPAGPACRRWQGIREEKLAHSPSDKNSSRHHCT